MEKERFAFFYNDQLTGVYNRDYLEYILTHKENTESRYNCVYSIYLYNFSEYNKKYGWDIGNKLLKEFANELTQKFNKGMVFRIFGDDFLLFHYEHNSEFENTQFKSLENSGVSFTFKHIDLHDKDLDIDSLELLKKDNIVRSKR